MTDMAQRLRTRRWMAGTISVIVIVALPMLFGHRGTHAVMNLLAPGSGLYRTNWIVAACMTALSVLAIVAWVRWGADWLVGVGMIASVIISMKVDSSRLGKAAVLPMAHEFPLIAMVWIVIEGGRRVVLRTPMLRRVLVCRQRETTVTLMPSVSRARTIAVLALVGDVRPKALGDVRTRAGRVNGLARGRFGGDVFRRDHAPSRAALAATGLLGDSQFNVLYKECSRSWAGVPCSEPGWLRPLDATLMALVLRNRPAIGQAWSNVLRSTMSLQGTHRPASVWTPLGIPVGRARDWEHAAFTALCRSADWIDHDRDWEALRQRALGAAARGTEVVDDERLIAASRCWLSLVDDPVAAQVLSRPTVQHDPLAMALDRVAEQLRSGT